MSQKVLITAAASGIELEIALAFSAAGAKVFIADINTQAPAAAKKEIPGVLTKVCDNSKRTEIEAMIRHTGWQEGRSDGQGHAHHRQIRRSVRCNPPLAS
jgi:NAD(P)-dependent dehydrogenase (short-subunit alcohol dehydrogenase family)